MPFNSLCFHFILLSSFVLQYFKPVCEVGVLARIVVAPFETHEASKMSCVMIIVVCLAGHGVSGEPAHMYHLDALESNMNT